MQAENATRENFIQKINPHVKLISLIYFVIVISIVNNLKTQIFITAFIFSLFLIARIKNFPGVPENIPYCIHFRLSYCVAGIS